MRRIAGTLIGKAVAQAVRVRGKSSGQAMPGLAVETLIPGYLGVMLRQLPDGVAIITGTNGKTTTTKMVVELLRANGKRVLTNSTGSNLTRGIISSVARQATVTGRLPFDIAVFELDEAYAYLFTDVLRPRWVLGLNASRDQLDRFGEVDTVARLIGDAMLTATERVIVNADDKRLCATVAGAGVPVSYFGVAPGLLKLFPRDDELVAVDGAGSQAHAEAADVPLDVELLSFAGGTAKYRVGAPAGRAGPSRTVTSTLQVTGQHNFQNAAGALALAHVILPDADAAALAAALGTVRPAFGRGQAFKLRDGSLLQLNLVKNPASFRQSLASYAAPDSAVMLAINDNVADSRDMSWLWDVDFASLRPDVVCASGSRAADMALRLRYDEVDVRDIEPDLEQALRLFGSVPGRKVIFASYTAMLRLHRLLEHELKGEL